MLTSVVLRRFKVRSFFNTVCFLWQWFQSALSAQDQDAADHMFEDQGMDIEYNALILYTSADSDQESETGDSNEFTDLTKCVAGWCVPDIAIVYHIL